MRRIRVPLPRTRGGRRALQAGLTGAMLAALGAPANAEARDISRDTLPANDGWTPALHGTVDSAAKADRDVARGAGAGRIR
ncbi:hypothetical protein ACH4UV_12065 [Streptomyces sp. NPDC020802]|uniref:hypothetical protein n=1 Tax=Streptomyces sp. NPDC020802 TaxID=3365094 RepID=UPI00378F5476